MIWLLEQRRAQTFVWSGHYILVRPVCISNTSVPARASVNDIYIVKLFDVVPILSTGNVCVKL